MKKIELKQLINRPTRRMRILGVASLTILAISTLMYYVGVVSPALTKAYSGSGVGDTMDPYQITTCEQLQEMKQQSSAYFVLMNDIDCSATSSWNNGLGFDPVADFAGNLDGRNFAIKDLYINRPVQGDIGLIAYAGQIQNAGVIKNLRLEKSPGNADRIDITGGVNVGALVGVYRGTKISNVHSDLNVRTMATTSSGTAAFGNVGGIVGLLSSKIDHSSSSGTVSLGLGSLAGRHAVVGGLVGLLDGGDQIEGDFFVTNSYSTSPVKIEESTNAQDSYCGGLVGRMTVRNNIAFSIKDSYSAGDVSCSSPVEDVRVGGFIGDLNIGDGVQVMPVITHNFSVSKVTSTGTRARGFLGSYFMPTGTLGGEQVNFSTNAFDVTRSQQTLCGDTEGINCIPVNANNIQPNYFYGGAVESDEFFSTWEQTSQWEFGSSYPAHLPYAVRTNAPTNLSVSRDGANFVASWTNPSGDGDRTRSIGRYQVLVWDASISVGAVSATVIDVDANNASVTLTGLNSDPGRYRVRVRAVYTPGESPDTNAFGLSSTVFEFGIGMPESAPANITSNPLAKSLVINWDSVTKASKYAVQYRQEGATTWIDHTPGAGSLSQNSRTIYGLIPNTGYEVRIQAQNEAGSGPWSQPITFTTIGQTSYTITNCQQLQDISNDLEGIYTLGQNIDCNGVGFQPIGGNNLFVGTLNGNGKTISNVTINRHIEDEGGRLDFVGAGLFAATYQATIKDLTMQNTSVVVTYTLNENVDSDQNGLPDAPDIDFTDNFNPRDIFDRPEQAFGSVYDVISNVGLDDDLFYTSAKIGVGGVAGLALGSGIYTNITMQNNFVTGAVSGGVFGVVLPIRTLENVGSDVTYDPAPATVMENIHSDGLIVGHVAGGIVGGMTGPLSNAIGPSDGSIIINNSSSSAEVQGTVAGGLLGVTLGSSLTSLITTIFTSNLGGDTGSLITAFDQVGTTQDLIIQNSHSSGKVSLCDAPSGIRIGALGGVVGLATNALITDSYATGEIKACSATASGWGVYGGAQGGLAGIMIASRIVNSYSTGNITAVNNDTIDQASQFNMYLGATGGLSGLMVNTATNASEKPTIANSYSTGSTTADSKQGYAAFSGGLTGMYLGTGSIVGSHSTGNITHHLTNKFVGGAMFSGGLNGVTLGVDVPFIYKSVLSRGDIRDASSPGVLVDNSYATGKMGVHKDASGTSFSVSGGLMGAMIGQGSITNSHATGAISSGLPDTISSHPDALQLGSEGYEGFTAAGLTQSTAGAALSGGLIGSTIGLDVPPFMSTVIAGFTGASIPLFDSTQQGITIDSTYASGSVTGNVAGGLIGSVDLKTSMNKSYATGNVSGAISGGLVGQGGALEAAVKYGITTYFGIGYATDSNTSVEEAAGVGAFIDKGMTTLGPVTISNTYSSGAVTGTPGLAEINLSPDSDAVVQPIKLPSVAGGIAGIFMSPGGKITDSYASGDLTITSEKSAPPKATNGKAVYKVEGVPSFAGGIVGIDIALPNPSAEKTLRGVKDHSSVSRMSDYVSGSAVSAQTIKNVFSTSKMTLNNNTMTGGSIGGFTSPLHTVNALFLGQPASYIDSSKLFTFQNVYLDKTKVTASQCNGPNKGFFETVDPVFNNSAIPIGNDQDLFVQANPNQAPQEVKTALDGVTEMQTACQYVNSDASQPRYFIQNNTNAPMNSWNFSNTWKVVQNDYPKFVAGAQTDMPNNPANPGGPADPTAPTNTGSQPPQVTTATNIPAGSSELLKNSVRNLARQLGVVGDEQQVKGLKVILASIPAFIAKSVPYSLVLLLLLLAGLYAAQALKEYRQLRVYHQAVTRIANTKEAIDNYLAITTHYLNTPVAIMNGAVELMSSLKKIAPTKAAGLTGKIKRFSDASAALLVANQVSNAQSVNSEKLVEHKRPSPYRTKAVLVPAGIALGLLITANVLFIYADVFSRSPFRIVIEFGLYLLAVLLIGLAYRYRNFMSDTKEITKRQLALETDLYKKRVEFIPQAQAIVADHYETLQIASEPLKKVSEAKLFLNGLQMLSGINQGLTSIKRFSQFSKDAPLFDVTAYVKKSVNSLSAVSKERNLRIIPQISGGIVLHIQPDEVKQLVDSLLDNATKFTKDGGEIRVTLTRRFNKVTLSVEDNGLGISEEKLPSLLKPFTRGTDSMQYNYDGIGLSLYTNKIITDKLGGDIRIRSKLGSGTNVTITLPAEREVAAALVPVTIVPDKAG